ncbi:hypothetical protein [Psychrobacillus lasiicapitis]|uniref:Uncharacterized protein n=1 Tax=Psychrobacillus lasiicapitis TaxID=1636719 RepID=A0A544T8X5_9BACI|nr:hypothetical protein [Psychrobacillus lasiicapitis]TQR13856.1 hypothetical protein FG382_09610 [Psychrobacillus lasiicapitis]
MKEFKVNMTRRFVQLASEIIRTKNDIIMLLLEAIPLLSFGEIVERPDNNYIVLRVDKMKRLFFVIDDKIYSFNFPFNVDVLPEVKNPVIYDSMTDLEITGVNHAVITTTFQEIFNGEENQGILDLDSDVMRILESFEQQPNKDQIWQILKKLLVFESGYLRYDYDVKLENGRLHPLHHLDINYTTGNTFKVGINNTINCVDFIDILDTGTNCYYISK